ncbi:MAG: ATP-binding protein [Leptolyngbyaceae cyanobacterium bins.59]|nr:ATP-binding protein [Leptolyngbyaceae cyanobacterium bins.59]
MNVKPEWKSKKLPDHELSFRHVLSFPKLHRVFWPGNGLNQWVSNLPISQKIAWGYTLVLGIAVTGITLGFLTGTYYRNQAEKQRADAIEESRLPREIRAELLSATIHQQKLLLLTQTPEALEQEYSKLQTSVQKAQRLWIDFKTSYENPVAQESSEELELFQEIVEEHDGLLESYAQTIQTDFAPSKLIALSSANPSALQQQFSTFSNNLLTQQLFSFLEDVEEVVEVTAEEEQEAELALQEAKALKHQIIVFSLGISVLSAIGIGLILVRSITHPIHKTTHLAEQVIRDNNFDLQAPIMGRDEIGQLTQTLNELIQRVRQLLLEQKAAELQLIQNEKMSSLGQLVAGVAHEINNPVNFIHGNLDHAQEYSEDLVRLITLYERYYSNPPLEIQDERDRIDLDFLVGDLAKLLQSMKTGTDRIRNIVLSLRNFSRLDESSFKSVDIQEGIESTILLLQHRLKATPERPAIKLVRDYQPLPMVECYPGQLNQVFMNLISNAIDALEEHHQKSSFDARLTNPMQIQIQTEQLNTEWVAIRIADSGPGIPSEIRDQLFNAFFTTKPMGKGTGLGLSISQQIIVEKHKGRLFDSSNPEQGAEFTIELPIQH